VTRSLINPTDIEVRACKHLAEGIYICLDPNVVLALVDVVKAAHKQDAVFEGWETGARLRAALTRFDFEEEA
jgi:hypothetical protein